MDNFLQVIDQRVKKTIIESNIINTTPCIVLNQVDLNNFSVKMLSNDCIYVLPNLSGSALAVGDVCQVFYKGSFNQRNCFIGAALNRQSTTAQYLNFDIVGNMPTLDFMPLANCKILSSANSPSLLSVNINVQGLAQTEFGIQILVNDEVLKTIYKTIAQNEKEVITYSSPLDFESNHKYKVQLNVKGNVELLDFECFVYGFGIERTTIYDPTTDEDYIYDVNNHSIIYYIGDSKNPQIPQTIQNTEVNKIYATGFNYDDVESVYIPEGIVEIE